MGRWRRRRSIRLCRGLGHVVDIIRLHHKCRSEANDVHTPQRREPASDLFAYQFAETVTYRRVSRMVDVNRQVTGRVFRTDIHCGDTRTMNRFPDASSPGAIEEVPGAFHVNPHVLAIGRGNGDVQRSKVYDGVLVAYGLGNSRSIENVA